MQNLITIKEASIWASNYIGKNVSPANISYLIQYARVAKKTHNGSTVVNRDELKHYYNSQKPKEEHYKNTLGNDLNWHLSFEQYKEAETTKHVHRLHSYKGKFIPQLVEYFLDSHTDSFKKQVFFNKGEAILDPFCGSGTTLIQANELGLNAIGIDVSTFNAFISNTKIANYNVEDILNEATKISQNLAKFQQQKQNTIFETELLAELKTFNAEFFPSPDFKYKVSQKIIDDKAYGNKKAGDFLVIYQNLIKKYNIKLTQNSNNNTFLDKWFLQAIRDEIDFVFKQIKTIKNPASKKILSLILSRTTRSVRATTHADLATLKTPITTTYYCKKHGKICKPLFSIYNWWKRYVIDTVNRIKEFDKLKTNTFQYCLTGDSREINIAKKLTKIAPHIKKFAGIFSSPPYVGLIDYHNQHAYAYDLFGFDRKDELEIGALYKGQGKHARESYTTGVADVLINSKKYLKQDYDIFLVANDKYNLYPKISQLANMNIVNRYKRPVLNRVEKDRSAYAEIIFHLKEK